MKHPDHLPESQWKTIVENLPLVSVDLIILYHEGILLGKRNNPPAKGEWFVPGGLLKKNETLENAAHRVAMEEIGTDIEIERKMGTYEHFYEHSEFSDVSKHYVVYAFTAAPQDGNFTPNSQHSELKVFKEPPENLHPYVKEYLRDLGWE